MGLIRREAHRSPGGARNAPNGDLGLRVAFQMDGDSSQHPLTMGVFPSRRKLGARIQRHRRGLAGFFLVMQEVVILDSFVGVPKFDVVQRRIYQVYVVMVRVVRERIPGLFPIIAKV